MALIDTLETRSGKGAYHAFIPKTRKQLANDQDELEVTIN
jgi:hypothetical protein